LPANEENSDYDWLLSDSTEDGKILAFFFVVSKIIITFAVGKNGKKLIVN
jgi:hypothetical protein